MNKISLSLLLQCLVNGAMQLYRYYDLSQMFCLPSIQFQKEHYSPCLSALKHFISLWKTKLGSEKKCHDKTKPSPSKALQGHAVERSICIPSGCSQSMFNKRNVIVHLWSLKLQNLPRTIYLRLTKAGHAATLPSSTPASGFQQGSDSRLVMRK